MRIVHTPSCKARLKEEGRTEVALTQVGKEKELKSYSWEPESPLLLSPLEEPGLPPPAAAFCCFSRASRMRAVRERRTLLRSVERTFTRTWSPSFNSSRTSRM